MKAVRISSEKYLEHKMAPTPKSDRDPTTRALLTPAEAYIRDGKGTVVREWKDRFKNTYALYDDDGAPLAHVAVVATEAGMEAAVKAELQRHKKVPPPPAMDIGAKEITL